MRKRQEELDRKSAEEIAKEEHAKQIRFELGRAEARAQERAEREQVNIERARSDAREELRWQARTRREKFDREALKERERLDSEGRDEARHQVLKAFEEVRHKSVKYPSVSIAVTENSIKPEGRTSTSKEKIAQRDPAFNSPESEDDATSTSGEGKEDTGKTFMPKSLLDEATMKREEVQRKDEEQQRMWEEQINENHHRKLVGERDRTKPYGWEDTTNPYYWG